ncbi:PTS transporter subunit EIIC [Streptomyces sp. NPDC021100]|uniref:PTS transporter subunit EIIC n=1 Tax=Streptomyces sp. NPDC021100 TaxID=3365114 RepID=UPI0037A28E92
MGQSLALPITAMPAAGLLLRLGQPDILGRYPSLHTVAAVLSGAGGVILDYLPLLFAIGLGLGLSRGKEHHGPVLACVLSYLVFSRTVLTLADGRLDTPPARMPYGALSGIVAGLLALAVWRVVEHRAIPGFVGYGLVALCAAGSGALLGLLYPSVDQGLTTFAQAVSGHAVLGGGLFGFVNRILTPIGLHHIPNALVWYVSGDCGNNVRGDMPCFFQQHDPHAGIFMSGFFPVADFGLPAAALAMWRSALPAQRRRTRQVLLPAAIMSFAFGITEPIELAFAFTAAPLLLIHASLTGLSMALVNALDIHTGFVFSAGTLDLILNAPISQKPLLLLPIGAVYAVTYYTIFRFAITRFHLSTPGRTTEEAATSETAVDRKDPRT